MASVKVAVRVRPLNTRELSMNSPFIIQMDGKKTSITNLKVPGHGVGDQSRERQKDFVFDYSYWSLQKTDPKYASQEQVFRDLGTDVISSAYEGYNACVFAYGQTGSGKTYTMMGNPSDEGLIPRICGGLFAKMKDESMTYRAEVSYLEIYNEKVRDLLKGSPKKSQHSLRVREHPKEGPYVQDLSKHIVMNYQDIEELMERGNSMRTTASTNMNDTSSRSHAIFTIVFTQARFSKDSPKETRSKIHLVDLAGSERADATGATGDRLKEGGSINKSLVTLGNVISALADMSEKGPGKKLAFIPYRDSVLTWLLKDSLGGNAKTIMIATISPAACNYAETLSTLRYANRAKNIINKPTVNEDPNVKLIRELKMEIQRLRTLLGGKMENSVTPKMQEKLHESEARVQVLTNEWTGKWADVTEILKEEKTLGLRKQGTGVILDSELPHLIGLDDDLLSTGIMLYHLKEGETTLGSHSSRDIVLSGPEIEECHCIIENHGNDVIMTPLPNAQCLVNGEEISNSTPLHQGAIIVLGTTNMFRFNHPAQVAKLRESHSNGSLSNDDFKRSFASLSQSMSDISLARSTDNLALATSGWDMIEKHKKQAEELEEKRLYIEEIEEKHREAELKRLQEQEENEKELQFKKEEFKKMQEEAEKKQKEAEQAQIQMQKERAKLQRRSMDIEKQYFMIMKKRSEIKGKEQPVESPAGVESDQLKQEKEKLKQEIKDEINNLKKQEQEIRDRINQQKAEIAEKQQNLEAEKEKQQLKLKERELELDKEETQQRKKLEEIDNEIRQRKMEMELKAENETKFIKREKEHLEALKADYSLLQQYGDEIDASTRERLQKENDRINTAQEQLSQREKLLYDLYQQEQNNVMDKKIKDLEKLKEDKESLEADKILLKECEEMLDKASKAADPNDLELQKDLQKEKEGIDKERLRIESVEKELEERGEVIEQSFKVSMDDLQIERDKQILSLNDDKENLKKMKSERDDVLQEEILKKDTIFDEIMEQLERDKRDYEALENKCALARSSVQEQLSTIESGRKELSDLKDKLHQDFEKDKKELDINMNDLENVGEEEADLVSCRCKLLNDFEANQLDGAIITEEDLKKQRNHFERIRHCSDKELRAQQAEENGNEESIDKESVKLQEKMKAMEEQFAASVAELEEKRRKFEEERLQELDRIEIEKFKLQEMEDEERLNALVEEEVKSRLREQKVEREKQRKMEREKQRQQMAKMRRDHVKEIQRIKELYESNERRDSFNSPTRANPYASNMVANAQFARTRSTPNLARSSSRMTLVSVTEGNPIVVSIPCFYYRGTGFDSHVEFEVKIQVMDEAWTIYRRYSKFRELHNDLKEKFPQIRAIVFPPKKFLSSRSERVQKERRTLLENYLRNVIEILQRNPDCCLSPSRARVYSKQTMHNLHSFFKKGDFETSKYGTG